MVEAVDLGVIALDVGVGLLIGADDRFACFARDARGLACALVDVSDRFGNAPRVEGELFVWAGVGTAVQGVGDDGAVFRTVHRIAAVLRKCVVIATGATGATGGHGAGCDARCAGLNGGLVLRLLGCGVFGVHLGGACADCWPIKVYAEDQRGDDGADADEQDFLTLTFLGVVAEDGRPDDGEGKQGAEEQGKGHCCVSDFVDITKNDARLNLTKPP